MIFIRFISMRENVNRGDFEADINEKVAKFSFSFFSREKLTEMTDLYS